MAKRGIEIYVHPHDEFVLSRPPSEHPSDRLCLMCSNHGGNTCKQCRQAAYCSTTCQKKDWKTHKHVCEAFANFTETTRPSEHHVRVLVFPADSDVPRWAWIDAKDNIISSMAMFEHIGEFPEEGNLGISSLHAQLTTKGRGLAALSNNVEQATNSSVLALGKPGELHVWPGSLLVVGFLLDEYAPPDEATGTRPGVISDLGMRDYRNAIDGLLINAINPCVADSSRYPFKKLLAVKMTCVGERFVLAVAMTRKPIETCVVPAEIPLLCAQWVCAFPFMLGLPWVCRVVTPDCFNAPKAVEDSLMHNPEANLLSARFVFATDAGGNEVVFVDGVENPGTVFIMDVYGQPIHQTHIRAVGAFLRQNQEIKAHKHDRSRGRAADSTDSLSKLDREHFEAFWDRLKTCPWGDLMVAKNTPSPYERKLEPLKESPLIVSAAEWAMFGRVIVTDEPIHLR
ncbi:uncharacterized protein B0I36DRAFT_12967 [Microdochium trichocladiopsis]|uniref:MYND-type domain-containing protein n=1 Tax=Microdochium trichocladiopsis TaxID=1682393 RepID=A0A9P9BWH7_9PEZI|nr:uncharacterized protein B0I36DRAFT_12967 [Microdochium trichocladiopsis]KAH7040605.1 hypothetical protein B0I36DRAFT_12967 [Microdochium trichocladiopsis]